MRKIYAEFVRFVVAGAIAIAAHFLIYWLCQLFIDVNVSYSIGYVLSAILSYFLTARLTFRTSESAGNAVGFVICYVLIYLLQMGLLNLFMWLGMDRLWAFVPTYCIAGPANFLLLRVIFKKF